jgi:ethanolamine utilization microcompartment shell protein EutS
MADQYIQVPADGVGKKVDVAELDVAGQTVERQRIVIGSNTASANFAAVLSSEPSSFAGGLVVRNIPGGTQAVTGQISLAEGTANIGIINNISATVSVVVVSGLALNASTANIGTINNVSATVTVAGNIVLATGTNNIGTLNGISATVNVLLAAGGNNIGGVSLVAGTSNIGFLDRISKTVDCVLAAGGNNIGYINNISATVAVGLAFVFDATQQTNQVHVGDSANSAIRVNIVAGAAAGGTSMADGTGFVAGTTAFTPSGGVMDDVATGVVAEGSAGAVRITPHRAFHVNLRTSSGSTMEDTTNNALRVNIVAGGGTGGIAAVDGAAFTAQTSSYTPIGGVVDDAAPGVLAEGSAGAVRVTPNRALHVNFRDSAGAELGAASATGIFIRTATVVMAGGVGISGTAVVAGNVNISTFPALVAGTANIGAVSLAAGTAKIGFISKISAAVAVTGTVSLGAGTNLIGAVSLGAGTAKIGYVGKVSATGTVVLAAGGANIGSINNISRTVVCGLAYALDSVDGNQVRFGDSANTALRVNIVADVFATAVTAVPSSSHGPVMVNCSVSTTTTLITGPGAGVSIYITQLAVSNNNATNAVLARIGTSASASAVVMIMAAAGGGFVMNFDPPWKLSASEAAICSVKPGGGSAFFNVNFYVAA